MAGNTVDLKSSAAKPDGETKTRERSTIAFPYNDLDNAISVASALHENAGLSCETESLAAYMNQSAMSGAFRLNTSTARIFGLVETERGHVNLTELGRRIVDPAQEEQARAEAFLAVPLYSAIYEKYKGHMLPPTAALEREMAALGVSSKQTNKARQAFDRSAQQAGFFNHGKDRLVIPSFHRGAAAPEPERSDPKPTQTLKTGGGGGGHGDLPYFILGLLEKLPGEGEEWPIAERQRWLQTAINAFDLMYSGNEKGVTIKVTSSPNGQQQPS